MQNLITEFLNYISLERGLSKNTFLAYKRDLERYASFLKKKGKDFADVEPEDITNFLWQEKEKKKAAASLARNLAAIKSLHRFLVSYGFLKEDITNLISSPKLGRKLPRVLDIKEVDVLLEQPLKQRNWQGRRDKAILELLYATGVRVSELSDLTIVRIDLKEKIIRCVGKGSKERIVPFGRKAAEAIRRYLKIVRPKLNRKNSDYLFLTVHGNRMSRQRIWQMLKKYIRSAGIEKEISPHTLRHSFATHLLQRHASLRVVQDMLGHSNVVTTEIYSHLSPHRLKGVHQDYHPLGKE